MKHDWQVHTFAKGHKTAELSITSCSRCGFIKNEKNKDADCRGNVKVALRGSTERDGPKPVPVKRRCF